MAWDEEKSGNVGRVVLLLTFLAVALVGLFFFDRSPAKDADGIAHLKAAAERKNMQWLVTDYGEMFCADAWTEGEDGIRKHDFANVKCAEGANGNYAAGKLAEELNNPKPQPRPVAGSHIKP